MLFELLKELEPFQASLVAVSKTKPVEAIQVLYDEGQRAFGENRVQELMEKVDRLPRDIQWHMIGHLQTNKIKYIAPYIHLIQSADRPKLIRAIQVEGEKIDRVIPVLLQLHIAAEETKFGFTEEELQDFFEKDPPDRFDHVEFQGVMAMATFTEDQEQIRSEFARTKAIYDRVKAAYFAGNPAFKECSMGMSGDYKIALEEGATMIRVGTLLFGPRPCLLNP